MEFKNKYLYEIWKEFLRKFVKNEKFLKKFVEKFPKQSMSESQKEKFVNFPGELWMKSWDFFFMNLDRNSKDIVTIVWKISKESQNEVLKIN